MIAINLTDHAAIRLSQRAMRSRDVELAMLIGVEVEDGLLVLDRDAEVVAGNLVRLAERVRRLAGARLVQVGPTTVTAYRATRRKQKHLLRHAEDRNMEC